MMEILDSPTGNKDIKSDLDSTEVNFYKMMNDSNHRVMLLLLEVLMNSETSIGIEELTEKLFSKNISEDMKKVYGFNTTGLKCFLKKYPSLFQFDGNLISAIDVTQESNIFDNVKDWDSDSYRLKHSININEETEAVKYFQSQLLRQESHWMTIKSLAGHLSQATQSIRKVVGSQGLFRRFIQKHPHVFQIRGDFVSLRDNFSSLCLSKNSKNIPRLNYFNNTCSSSKENFNSKIRNSSKKKNGYKSMSVNSESLLSIDSLELQAVNFLKVIICRKTCTEISINHLFLYLARAPISIKDYIGWSKIELEAFIRKHSNYFHIDKNNHITTVDNDEESLIINANQSNKNGVNEILNHCGIIYHVTKFWGIVDLGHHEHVFFDKSIFKNLDDLQKHFQIGECIYFNAILAPKQSRAKWRAVQIWKELDNDIFNKCHEDLECSKFNNHHYSASDCGIESTLNDSRIKYDIINQCGNKNKEGINLNLQDSIDHLDAEVNFSDIESYSDTTASSPTQSLSIVKTGGSIVDSYQNKSRSQSFMKYNKRSYKLCETRSVATQTISTGDIMAIQVYLEIIHS